MQSSDAKIIYIALDKLMRCKGKPLMDAETKSAWIEYLMPYELVDVVKGIDELIMVENPWPEVATVIKYTKDHKRLTDKIARNKIAYQEYLEKVGPSGIDTFLRSIK